MKLEAKFPVETVKNAIIVQGSATVSLSVSSYKTPFIETYWLSCTYLVEELCFPSWLI